MTHQGKPSVYDKNVVVASFDKNFIQKPTVEIDVKYWKTEIQNILDIHQKNTKSPLYGIYLSTNNHRTPNGHVFYLDNVHENIPVISHTLNKLLSGCDTRHEMKPNSKDPFRDAICDQWKTYILVTPQAQQKVNNQIARVQWIRARCKPVDICLLILCIFGFLLFVTLLDRHWEGYDSPWKNIYDFGIWLTKVNASSK